MSSKADQLRELRESKFRATQGSPQRAVREASASRALVVPVASKPAGRPKKMTKSQERIALRDAAVAEAAAEAAAEAKEQDLIAVEPVVEPAGPALEAIRPYEKG